MSNKRAQAILQLEEKLNRDINFRKDISIKKVGSKQNGENKQADLEKRNIRINQNTKEITNKKKTGSYYAIFTELSS